MAIISLKVNEYTAMYVTNVNFQSVLLLKPTIELIFAVSINLVVPPTPACYLTTYEKHQCVSLGRKTNCDD